ncbi:hypothetical protein Q7P37_007530 [Cladosporium fusiforme]
MRISAILFSCLALASALPSNDAPGKEKHPKSKFGSFDLVGYAKDNPIGTTTGGAKGEEVTVRDGAALLAAVTGTEPRTIYVEGRINVPSRLRVGSNKSIIGIGNNAEIRQNGMTIIHATNVIVRNLAIRFIVDNDGITIQNSTRIWIDHNEFESEFSEDIGPDYYDGQLDTVRGSDWITISWNYFHDHWKSNLIGNSDALRDVDFGKLHLTYHHNYWRNCGTRGPSGRFGHQHIYNNLYVDYRYQAIQSRSDNQMLVEANAFFGKTRTAATTYGLVIPEDSPNSGPEGDFEIDGYMNLGAKNYFGDAAVNITQVGNFKKAPYKYKLTDLYELPFTVLAGVGVGKL